MDLSEALDALEQAFQELDVRWYVFGAQAAILYGVPRMTADLDVTIEPPDRGRLEAVFEAHHLEIAVEQTEDFLRVTPVIPVIHRPTGIPIDIVVGHSGLEASFFERASLIEMSGKIVPVIRIEDLVIAKVLAGRPKDLQDVRHLLRVQLDDAYVVKVLKLVEEALGQSDLVAEFEQLRQSS